MASLAEVEAKLPKKGTRVSIFGSTEFWHEDAPEACRLLGHRLAELAGDQLVLLTGANSMCHRALSQAFYEAVQAAAGTNDAQRRVFHLHRRGYKCRFGFGTLVEAGQDSLERREFLARSCRLAITVEGGPGTADEMCRAIAAGNPVLPLARLGGASSSQFVPRPRLFEKRHWWRLWDTQAPLAETVEVAAQMVVQLLGASPCQRQLVQEERPHAPLARICRHPLNKFIVCQSGCYGCQECERELEEGEEAYECKLCFYSQCADCNLVKDDVEARGQQKPPPPAPDPEPPPRSDSKLDAPPGSGPAPGEGGKACCELM